MESLSPKMEVNYAEAQAEQDYNQALFARCMAEAIEEIELRRQSKYKTHLMAQQEARAEEIRNEKSLELNDRESNAII